MSAIAGSESLGAESVVLGGEQSGDEDHGDVITYTGEGTMGDQRLTYGNAALATSVPTRAPVRVVRRVADASGGRAMGSTRLRITGPSRRWADGVCGDSASSGEHLPSRVYRTFHNSTKPRGRVWSAV